MVGEGSGIVPDRGLNILYRVTMNTLMNLTDTGLTRTNYGANSQATANTRLSTDTPKGILAGQIVKASTTAGAVDIATGAASEVALGFAINNAVGYPYESSSGVGSGKCPYIHGTGTVFSTDLYEIVKADGTTACDYTAGTRLYASQNGMLCTEQLNSLEPIAVVLIAPTTTDPFMVVQSLI